MRPRSVRIFDLLFLSALFLSVTFSTPRIMQHSILDSENDPFFLGLILAPKAIAIMLWILISRRNEIARWIFSIGAFLWYPIVVAGAYVAAKNPGAFGAGWSPYPLLLWLLHCSAAVMLWRGDARQWFSRPLKEGHSHAEERKRVANSDTIRRTDGDELC